MATWKQIADTSTAQTLTSKTLTSPVLNTGVSGTAVLDSDTMSGVSSTTLSSSESIKAYVDAQVDTADTISELADTTITSATDGDFLVHNGTAWVDEAPGTARASLSLDSGSTPTFAGINLKSGDQALTVLDPTDATSGVIDGKDVSIIASDGSHTAQVSATGQVDISVNADAINLQDSAGLSEGMALTGTVANGYGSVTATIDSINTTTHLVTMTADASGDSISGSETYLFNSNTDGGNVIIKSGGGNGTGTSKIEFHTKRSGSAVAKAVEITSAGDLSVTNNLTVTGNLDVNGTTTTIDTTNLAVADAFIVCASGASGDSTVDAGLEIERGDLTNAKIFWDASTLNFATTQGTATDAIGSQNGVVMSMTSHASNTVGGVGYPGAVHLTTNTGLLYICTAA
tara:strand:- start:1331 stop:2536 length:1206 start_codon:yes stop_codon:yes gene_type:complete